jgi:hypothetical protein
VPRKSLWGHGGRSDALQLLVGELEPQPHHKALHKFAALARLKFEEVTNWQKPSMACLAVPCWREHPGVLPLGSTDSAPPLFVQNDRHKEILTRELEAVGLRLNQRPPQVRGKPVADLQQKTLSSFKQRMLRFDSKSPSFVLTNGAVRFVSHTTMWQG